MILWVPIFLKKSAKTSIHLRNFFQKINVLRFKMVSNGKILKNFYEITHKSPHMLHIENFDFFENLTPDPKSLFIAFLRKKFWPYVLFYRSKKPILCFWSPSPLMGSVLPRIPLNGRRPLEEGLITTQTAVKLRSLSNFWKNCILIRNINQKFG